MDEQGKIKISYLNLTAVIVIAAMSATWGVSSLVHRYEQRQVTRQVEENRLDIKEISGDVRAILSQTESITRSLDQIQQRLVAAEQRSINAEPR